jgi:PKD repeat protein
MSRLSRNLILVAVAASVAAALGGARARAQTAELPAPTLTSPASPSKDATPTWTFTGEPGATFDCTLLKPFEGAWDGGGSGEDPPPPPVTIDHRACDSGTYTFDLGPDAGGTFTLSVTQSDAAGSTSPASEGSYYLDQTVYPPRITSGPDAVSADSTPTWGFYGEFGADFTCTLAHSRSTTPVDSSPCTVSHDFMDQSYTFDLAAYPDDTYTFAVVQTDRAGNVSAPSTASFVLDRSTPNSVPVVTFTSTCSQRDCTFDASSSFDVDGWIATFRFDFGDGTQVIQAGQWKQAWHTYNVAGTYTVTVTATDDEGAVASASRQVGILLNRPPTAAFTFTCSGLTCSGDGSASTDQDGTVQAYAWNFGDGTGGSGNGPTIQHTYAQAGTYTVGLTVTDNGEAAGTALKSVAVDAPNTPPKAAFTVNCTGLRCTVDAGSSSDSDGAIAGYSWTFGDAAVGSGRTTSHDYAKAGTYTLTLTVTDDDGASAAASQKINPIALSARGYKQGGQQKVDLSWNGVAGASFDVDRDGSKIRVVQGTAYTDVVPKGPGSHSYRVCSTAAATCSTDVTVPF